MALAGGGATGAAAGHSGGEAAAQERSATPVPPLPQLPAQDAQVCGRSGSSRAAAANWDERAAAVRFAPSLHADMNTVLAAMLAAT